MKKILFLLMGSLYMLVAFGQLQIHLVPAAEPSNNCENCTVPNQPRYQFTTVTDPPLDRTVPANPTETKDGQLRYRQYIEFGDGYFSNDFKDAFVQRQLAPVTSNFKPLIITYGIYTPKPPVTIISEYTAAFRTPGDVVPVVQKKILPGANVSVVTSINSVIPNDLMTFAIPFKKKDTMSNGVLIFFYNNKDIAAPVFKTYQTAPTIKWNTYDAGNMINIDALRGVVTNSMFNAVLLPGISSKVTSVIMGAADEFTDALVIDISAIKNSTENNIFLSLLTNDAEALASLGEGVNVMVKSVFVPYSSTRVPEDARNYVFAPDWGSFTEKLMYYPKSHDPNNTSISPNCVATATKNKRFTFTMHITNEAPGNVRCVWVQPHFKGANIKLKNIEMIKAFVGGRNINMNLQKGAVAKMPPVMGQFSINLDSLGIDSSYVFIDNDPVKQILLEGLPGGIVPETDTGYKVSADIVFTAEVVAIPDDPDSLFLVADVSFDDRATGMLPIFSTPRPGKLSVEKICGSPPPPPPFWCKYWWLWVLILLVIIALIFYRRKRHT